MDEPRTEMTTESLSIALEDCGGLIEAVVKIAPIKSVPELVAYLNACRTSPAHLRQLFEALSKRR